MGAGAMTVVDWLGGKKWQGDGWAVLETLTELVFCQVTDIPRDLKMEAVFQGRVFN